MFAQFVLFVWYIQSKAKCNVNHTERNAYAGYRTSLLCSENETDLKTFLEKLKPRHCSKRKEEHSFPKIWVLKLYMLEENELMH